MAGILSLVSKTVDPLSTNINNGYSYPRLMKLLVCIQPTNEWKC